MANAVFITGHWKWDTERAWIIKINPFPCLRIQEKDKNKNNILNIAVQLEKLTVKKIGASYSLYATTDRVLIFK